MTYWTVAGLGLDFVGVLLLGADLVRLQKALRETAKSNRERYDELEQAYGGVESWLDELAGQSVWVERVPNHPGHPSDLVHPLIEIVKNVSEASAGTAGRLARVASILEASAQQDERLAARSMRFSYVGLTLLVTGFALQIVGAA